MVSKKDKKEKKVTYKFSECREAFADTKVGGLALSLPHGSVVFECARHEVHATPALREPSRVNPTRIGKSNQLLIHSSTKVILYFSAAGFEK